MSSSSSVRRSTPELKWLYCLGRSSTRILVAPIWVRRVYRLDFVELVGDLDLEVFELLVRLEAGQLGLEQDQEVDEEVV